jgi:hypothetical protein
MRYPDDFCICLRNSIDLLTLFVLIPEITRRQRHRTIRSALMFGRLLFPDAKIIDFVFFIQYQFNAFGMASKCKML